MDYNALAKLLFPQVTETPEELEAICVYLAGDAATFTTGSDFIIDGAFTCF